MIYRQPADERAFPILLILNNSLNALEDHKSLVTQKSLFIPIISG